MNDERTTTGARGETPDAALEQELRTMTTWDGPSPDLAGRALRVHRSAGRTPRADRHALRRLWVIAPPRAWGLGLAAVVVTAVGVRLAMGPDGRAGLPWDASAPVTSERPAPGASLDGMRRSPFVADAPGAAAGEAGARRSLPGAGVEPGAPDAGRAVARSATIELRSADVPGAFERVRMLVQEARGEFVSDGSLRGADGSESASLTLRVASDRLSEVLTAIRALGTVGVETVDGEDVSDQLFDLGARIRNERGVERELLELLESRTDAPLADVLELRRHLSEIRGSIERLEARQARLDQLVALAKVLVLIRPAAETDAAAAKDAAAGPGAYVADRLGSAWRSGWMTLVDAAAAAVRVLVGGLLWWSLLLVLGLGIRRQLART